MHPGSYDLSTKVFIVILFESPLISIIEMKILYI